MGPKTKSKSAIVFAFLISGSLANSAPLCASYFSEARQSVNQYKTEAKSNQSPVMQAKYSNPRYEAQAAQTWTGVKGPEVLQAMLPEGMTFIDHVLPGASEEAVIKTSTGSMVHLRARLGKSGTNMGVNVNALKSNFSRDKKSVVRDDAEAVIVFIHGGGTKTTGHHVAASLMSWMNPRKVDVVSMDMPWHGEGSRVSHESVKASLEEMREYVKKYVAPAGKPIFLVGHSMGGVVSDLYMRMFPKDDLFSGVVPLSTVADALPGGTPEAKLAQESLINEKNRTNENIPASERDLGEALARQNKLSPTCGMFCQVLMFGIDWKMPQHQGQDFLPSLYVIGEGDGLYQGFEKSFQNFVGGLKKSELKILSPRRDIKDREGSLSQVGHLIFDHRPRIDFSADISDAERKSVLNFTIKEADFERLRAEGKIILAPEFKFEDINEPETFVLIKNFVAKITSKSLNKVKSDNAPLELVLQAYANNLAFREFAKTYIYQHLKGTEKSLLLGEEMEKTSREVRNLTQEKKQKGNLSEEQQTRLNTLLIRQKELTVILSSKGVVAPDKMAEFKALQERLQQINKQAMPALTQQRKQLKEEYDNKKSVMTKAEKTVQEYEEQLSSQVLDKARALKERVFKMMMDQDMRVRDLTNAYLSASHSNGQFVKNMFENMPAETIAAFEKFEKLAEVYQQALRKYELTLFIEAQGGRLQFTGDQQIKAEVEVKVHESALILMKNSEDLQKVLARIDEVDREAAALSNTVFGIEKQLSQLVGTEYFQPEYYTVEKILSQSINSARSNLDQINNILQRMWADWQRIWSLRISDPSESLY